MSSTFIPINPDDKSAVLAGLVQDLDSFVDYIPYGYGNYELMVNESPFGDVDVSSMRFGNQQRNAVRKTLAQYLVPAVSRTDNTPINYATYIQYTCPIRANGYSLEGFFEEGRPADDDYSYPIWLVLMWAFHVFCTVKKRSFDESNMHALRNVFADSMAKHSYVTQDHIHKMAENLVNMFFIRCNGNSAMPDKARAPTIIDGFNQFIDDNFSLKALTQNELNHRNAIIKAYDRLAISIMPSLNNESVDICCSDVVADLGEFVCGMYGFLPSVSANVATNREISFKQKYALWGAWA